jgi:hypothetical protein
MLRTVEMHGRSDTVRVNSVVPSSYCVDVGISYSGANFMEMGGKNEGSDG